MGPLGRRGRFDIDFGDLGFAGVPGKVYVPRMDARRAPLLAFAHDWTKSSRYYEDTLKHLASWGFIAAATDAPEPLQQFTATVCWLAEKPLRPGARLLLKHGTRTTQAIVGALDVLFDEQNLSRIDAPDTVELNQIGRITVQTAEPIPADDYQVSRESGSFLLIDPQGGNTLAAGLVGDALAPLHLKELV